MRVMVLAADNVIFIDGKGKALNCDGLRSRQVKVINWNDGNGVIEFMTGARRAVGSIDAQLPEGMSLQNLIDMAKSFEGS